MLEVIILILGLFLLHSIYEYIIRKPMLKDLSKQYVLITGCDSGFGKALAKKLDSMGCPVFAACYTVKGAADLQQETSSRLQTLQLDVTKEDSIKHAFNFVSSKIPNGDGLWGLVNNAGISGISVAPLEFHCTEDFQSVLNVNLLGMINMSNTFLPLLKTSRGRIVNMSSVAGRISAVVSAPYSVSKWAVETFSDCLRVYTKQYGIKVSILEPAFFKTNLLVMEKQIKTGYDRIPQDQKDTRFVYNYVEKFTKVAERLTSRANPNIDLVVDAYVHGLFGVHPKKRYSVGRDAYFIYVPLSYLPSCISDIISGLQIKKFMNAILRK